MPLVLTRRAHAGDNSTIAIGDPQSAEEAVEITVIEVRGNQVRLGVKAPREKAVHRKEVWEQRQQGQGDPPA